MRFNALLSFIPLITAIHGMVIVNLFGENPPTSLLSTPHLGYGEYESYLHGEAPKIQQVSTKNFRNQYMAVKNAKERKGYFVADWSTQSVNWVALAIGKDIPADEQVVADHVFELQILTMWMNARKKDVSYFGGNLDWLKDTLNSADNAVYISADLNCQKAYLFTKLVTDALEKKGCTPQPPSTLTNYLQHALVTHGLAVVPAHIVEIIKKSGGQADADDFHQVAYDVLSCLRAV